MIDNQDFVIRVLELMDTSIEAICLVQEYIRKENISDSIKILYDLQEVFSSIQLVADGLKSEEKEMNLPAAIRSCNASLKRILLKISEDDLIAFHKLEYELLPLVQEMKLNFYFWGYVFGNKEREEKYYSEEINCLLGNKYIDEAKRTGSYKYDVSIVVRGYNKLEYTKKCVCNLLENLPKEFTYELILVNHGSKDGTKEYFETIKSDKQLDIEVNGGGQGAMYRIIEGKYFLCISNDVIVTENALDNMYKCISSADDIAWVVPATSNVSNYQTPNIMYQNVDEMKAYVRKNNISNCYRWEQRVRLVNPIEIMNSEMLLETKFAGIYYEKSSMFPDDRLSLLFRRNGKRLILAKDSYCHHYGSVTHSNSNVQFDEGRKCFYKQYGVDPWGTGFCYDKDLFDDKFPLMNLDYQKILAINCGLCAMPLKIKELLYEIHKLKNTEIHCYMENETFENDLKGISNETHFFDNVEKLKFAVNEYDYILIDDSFTKKYVYEDLLREFYSALKNNGFLILRNIESNRMLLRELENNFKIYKISVKKDWMIWTKNIFEDGYLG